MDKNKWVTIILVIFLLVSFSACSAGKKERSWENWWGFKKEKTVDQKSLESFFANIRPASGNAESHLLLASHYQERGRHKQAIDEFKKVLSIDPKNVKAYNGLGVSFDHLKNHPLAIESYQRALEINSQIDYIQNNLGYSYFLMAKYDEAIKAFEKAISINPQQNRFHNNLALAYAEKGQFILSLNEFRKAGDEANAQYHMGQFYYRKSLYIEAKIHYAKALELNPSSPTFKSGFEAANNLAGIFASAKGKAQTPVTPASTSPSQEDKAENKEISKTQAAQPAQKYEGPARARIDGKIDRNDTLPLPSTPAPRKTSVAKSYDLLEGKPEAPPKTKWPEMVSKKVEDADLNRTTSIGENKAYILIPPPAPQGETDQAHMIPSSPENDSKSDRSNIASLQVQLVSPRNTAEIKSSISAIESKAEAAPKANPMEYAPRNEAIAVAKADISSEPRSNAIASSPAPSQKTTSESQSPSSLMEAKIKKGTSLDQVAKNLESKPAPPFKIAIGYELQVASFRSIDKADSLSHSLNEEGFQATVKPWKGKKRYEWYRTILGPFKTYQEALTAKKEVLQSNPSVRNTVIRLAAIKTDPFNDPTQGNMVSSMIPSSRPVGIEISNGNGYKGMAQMIGGCLNESGLRVVRLTNASNFDHPETIIFYQKGYVEVANYLAACFPFCNNMKEMEKLDRPHVNVKVLIGKDIANKGKTQGS